MLLAILTTLAGLLLLVWGGDVLLKGAVGLAKYLQLTPAVIGLTVVAAGTSVPELAVSGVAAWHGKPDITVGNVVGSNIFNIAFILGCVSIYRRLTLAGNTIKLEFPVLLLVTFLFIVLSMDGSINRLEGSLFVFIYIAFTAFLIRVVRRELTKTEESQYESEIAELQEADGGSIGRSILLTLAGITILGFAADLTVSGAVEVGRLVGMSESLIGLTIVAAGTGLPELVTSFVSCYRGRNDVAIANVIGSNLFNILGIIGLTSIVHPIPVHAGIIQEDNWWLLGVTIILFPIMRKGFDITKREGLVLLAVYIIYIGQLIVRG
ncbi:MAG: calcium/sodium antiporter [Deltaproteobacteria bacterium]|nr:calcium/sodium antiporter [Deltaproteobacteria bacterium]